MEASNSNSTYCHTVPYTMTELATVDSWAALEAVKPWTYQMHIFSPVGKNWANIHLHSHGKHYSAKNKLKMQFDCKIHHANMLKLNQNAGKNVLIGKPLEIIQKGVRCQQEFEN